MLATAATGLAIGGGALAAVTAGGGQRAIAATSGIPWLVEPSGDTTGAQDVNNVLSALSAYDVAVLGPGQYYGASPVVCHEGQYVCCVPGVTWQLTATKIPAFQWTPANPASYSIVGTGGIIGEPIIVGPTGANPSDGSIGVQMGDIVHLESDVFVQNCQYGLLLSNEHFWSERGNHRVKTQYCTNPVIAQCAPASDPNATSTRSGSFDRTWITWYGNESIGTGGMVNGVQLLNGAQFAGGGIRIYGNIGLGTGTVPQVYALYLDGEVPAGLSYSSYSSILDAEITLEIEAGNSISPDPGTIYLGPDCYILACGGQIGCNNFAGPSIDPTATFEYFGAIDGTLSSGPPLQAALWRQPAGTLTKGWIGSVWYKHTGSGDTVAVDFSLGIEAGTVVTNGESLGLTMPGGYYYASDNKLIAASLNGGGVTGYQFVVLRVSDTGGLYYQGPSFTASSSTAYFYGSGIFPIRV
jgi:hypothetical protein